MDMDKNYIERMEFLMEKYKINKEVAKFLSFIKGGGDWREYENYKRTLKEILYRQDLSPQEFSQQLDSSIKCLTDILGI